MNTSRQRMENVIHNVLYPGDREDRMTWPRSIFDIAEALEAAGYGDVREAQAEAWDEGGESAIERDNTYGAEEKAKFSNPYRTKP